MSYSEVKRRAADLDRTLLATDHRFQRSVRVQTDDGGSFFYPNAFALSFVDEKDYEWQLVFTEHHGFHVYDHDCLVWQYSNVDIDIFA